MAEKVPCSEPPIQRPLPGSATPLDPHCTLYGISSDLVSRLSVNIYLKQNIDLLLSILKRLLISLATRGRHSSPFRAKSHISPGCSLSSSSHCPSIHARHGRVAVGLYVRRQYGDDANASSRQELLQWMNSLLQLNVTKVEQCGTGYVSFQPKKKTRESMPVCYCSWL